MGMLFRASVKMQKVWICFLMAVLMPALGIALDEQANIRHRRYPDKVRRAAGHPAGCAGSNRTGHRRIPYQCIGKIKSSVMPNW